MPHRRRPVEHHPPVIKPAWLMVPTNLRRFPYRARPEYFSSISDGIDMPSSRFAEEAFMVQMYFHCSNAEGTLIDRYGTAVANLTEARDRAAQIMRSMIETPGAEDWRDWVIHISDDDGEEIFDLPFTAMLGKPH